MARNKSQARRSKPGLVIWLPHWMTPEFCAVRAAQRKRKRRDGETIYVPLLPDDIQARYEAIAENEDWGSPAGVLKWLPEYKGHLAYDMLKADMFIGRRVTKTLREWDNKPGTVTAISPTQYVVKVTWDHKPDKEIKYYIPDLKQWRAKTRTFRDKTIAAPIDDDDDTGHHDDPFITT